MLAACDEDVQGSKRWQVTGVVELVTTQIRQVLRAMRTVIEPVNGATHLKPGLMHCN